MSWQYIAGLVDADGSIGIFRINPTKTGKHSYYLRLQVTNAHVPLMNRLKGQLGGHIDRREKATAGHTQTYNWIAYGPAAVVIIKKIRPHLIVKAEQADVAIRFMTKFKRYYGGMPEDVRELRQSMWEEMARLKGHGSRSRRD
jgi:hypothetical protein